MRIETVDPQRCMSMVRFIPTFRKVRNAQKKGSAGNFSVSIAKVYRHIFELVAQSLGPVFQIHFGCGMDCGTRVGVCKLLALEFIENES